MSSIKSISHFSHNLLRNRGVLRARLGEQSETYSQEVAMLPEILQSQTLVIDGLLAILAYIFSYLDVTKFYHLGIRHIETAL